MKTCRGEVRIDPVHLICTTQPGVLHTSPIHVRPGVCCVYARSRTALGWRGGVIQDSSSRNQMPHAHVRQQIRRPHENQTSDTSTHPDESDWLLLDRGGRLSIQNRVWLGFVGTCRGRYQKLEEGCVEWQSHSTSVPRRQATVQKSMGAVWDDIANILSKGDYTTLPSYVAK